MPEQQELKAMFTNRESKYDHKFLNKTARQIAKDAGAKIIEWGIGVTNRGARLYVRVLKKDGVQDFLTTVL